jgi:hypothetical protein
MFGGGKRRALHRVSAHTRVRADGAEVYVGEHSRLSAGRAEPPPPGAIGARSTGAEGQLDLFAPAPPTADDTPLTIVPLGG